MFAVRLFVIAALAATIAGCASGVRQSGRNLAQGVDADAIGLNEAHTRTINGVITLNILRARDNWPTGYTTLSGISFSPEVSTDAGVDFAPLGLGNAANPFGRSAASLTRKRRSDARYSVNPFAEKPGASGLYKIEASEELFQRYLDSGWPIEAVFPLFVRRVAMKAGPQSSPDGETCDVYGDHELARRLDATFKSGNAVSAADDPQAERQNAACTAVIDHVFLGLAAGDAKPGVRARRWFYADANDYACDDTGSCRELTKSEKATRMARGHPDYPAYGCETMDSAMAAGLLAQTAEPLADRLTAIETASERRVRITSDGVGLCREPEPDKTLFQLGNDGALRRVFADHEFRSFNDMIYFLGETIRGGEALAVGNCAGPVPLFSVQETGPTRSSHAVEVQHAGVRHRALAKPSRNEQCVTDRTGTTLSILSQILLLNQSAEFLEAPESILER